VGLSGLAEKLAWWQAEAGPFKKIINQPGIGY
jgi:hypothetical protein